MKPTPSDNDHWHVPLRMAHRPPTITTPTDKQALEAVRLIKSANRHYGSIAILFTIICGAIPFYHFGALLVTLPILFGILILVCAGYNRKCDPGNQVLKELAEDRKWFTPPVVYYRWTINKGGYSVRKKCYIVPRLFTVPEVISHIAQFEFKHPSAEQPSPEVPSLSAEAPKSSSRPMPPPTHASALPPFKTRPPWTPTAPLGKPPNAPSPPPSPVPTLPNPSAGPSSATNYGETKHQMESHFTNSSAEQNEPAANETPEQRRKTMEVPPDRAISRTVLEVPRKSPTRETEALEGVKSLQTGYRTVRSKRLREAAIAIHGNRCCVCEFSFEETYGPDLGSNYIEVHRLNPVAGGKRRTNALTDLAPLCSNCHTMADKLARTEQIPPGTIESLRDALNPRKIHTKAPRKRRKSESTGKKAPEEPLE